VAGLESEVERLRSGVADSRARERELRDALVRLAAARRPWHRRAVIDELSARGLL
jgi:hypothetical protein